MNKIIFSILTLVWSISASAFVCSEDNSIENQYKNAEHVFLAYVLETRLEPALAKQIINPHAMKNNTEAPKLISADYQIIEEFKGKLSSFPRLVELLGLGTGYVGLIPGVYYVVFLPKPVPGIPEGYQGVNICNVPLAHEHLHNAGFQSELSKIRALKGKQKY